MSPVLPPRRPIVFKASRDTLILLVAASGLALAIGYSVHTRPPAPEPQGPTTEQTAAGEWAGQLAALKPAPAIAPPAEPLSSDALTVPKSAMALPVAPRVASVTGPMAVSPAKPKPCDGAACPPKPAATTRKPAAIVPVEPVHEASLIDRLNPLKHLPDMVTHPFASAGDTIAGWVKRF